MNNIYKAVANDFATGNIVDIYYQFSKLASNLLNFNPIEMSSQSTDLRLYNEEDSYSEKLSE